MKIVQMFMIPALALAGIGEPQAGWMRSADSTVRVLSGVAGSFVPGERVATGAVRCAFSGAFGVVKLAGIIRLADGTEFEAPVGDAVFGPGLDSNSIAAYFPSEDRAGVISASGIQWLNVDAQRLGGDVRALSGSTFYVTRADGLHAVEVRISDGAIESDLALGIEARIAIALPGGMLVYGGKKHELVVRSADGGESSVALDGRAGSLSLMNSDAVQVTLVNGHRHALRIRPGSVRLYEIPEVPQ